VRPMSHHQRVNRDGLVEVTLDPDGVLTPCSIMPSRYGGMYEGGAWVAFPMTYPPKAAFDSDAVVAAWYAKHDWRVGSGPDPSAALADLVARLEAAEKIGRARITRPEQ
jgi:hypothetical protein